jgi:hypothetical protein
MLRSRVYVIVCVLFGVLAIHAAHVGNVIVRVNAYGADIRQMADSGVKTHPDHSGSRLGRFRHPGVSAWHRISGHRLPICWFESEAEGVSGKGTFI